MNDIRDKQPLVLEAISNYTASYGYPPCLRDIERLCEISSISVVVYNLKALEQRGLIERTNGIARSLVITAAGRRALEEA